MLFRIDRDLDAEHCRAHAKRLREFARREPAKAADYVFAAALWEDLGDQYERLEEIRAQYLLASLDEEAPRQ